MEEEHTQDAPSGAGAAGAARADGGGGGVDDVRRGPDSRPRARTRSNGGENKDLNAPPSADPPAAGEQVPVGARAAGIDEHTAATLDAAAQFEYHSDFDWDSQHGEEAWSIRCYDVHKRLGGIPVLDGLNVAIPDETVTVVLGPSGTGKSVLIKHLIGLMFPDSGDVVVHGQSVPKLTMPELLALRRRIGVLFQDGALFGSMSLYDNVAFPLRQHTDMSETQISARVRQRLTDVGLADAMDFAPNQLSGGMRKRAGFARALVMEPDVVIFDEPDSGLDPVRTALLCELIKEMHGQYGGTYIVVTHDIASARRIGEFIALLWRGRIVEAGDAEKMFSSENPFVRQFLSGSAEGPLGMD
jgi:phospholipid/cholesterol/gamma-HCH transport system ATP-binding protein